MLTTCVEKTDPQETSKNVTITHVLPFGKNTEYVAKESQFHYAIAINSMGQTINQFIAEPAISMTIVDSTIDVDGSISASVPIRLGTNIVTLNYSDMADLDGATISNVERIASGIVVLSINDNELEI